MFKNRSKRLQCSNTTESFGHMMTESFHHLMCRFKILTPELSDFLLDLHRSLVHQGFAKLLDTSTGMPVVNVFLMFCLPFIKVEDTASPALSRPCDRQLQLRP
jgi:hypothetical protein